MINKTNRQTKYFVVNLFNNAIHMVIAKGYWNAMKKGRKWFNTGNVRVIEDRLSETLHY